MTLEERIKQMLEESNKQEATQEVVAEEVQVVQTEVVVEAKKEVECEDEVEETKAPTIKVSTKKLTKESSEVSSQVSALLEAEGLSEEFKVQAVTIFEAAVTDRVLQIQESLEAQYNEQLDEARAEIETNIDGFLNEAIAVWAKDNEVAIAANFKSRIAESFMDGLQGLLAEHNIELPTDKVDAFEVALDQVTKLEEASSATDAMIAQLQEQVDELKAEKILESFKQKMTSTEFDRFVQLTESVKFADEEQYEKQLTVVLENFGKITAKKQVIKQEPTPIVEETVVVPQAQTIVTESYSNIDAYAKYLTSRVGKV